MRPHKNLTAAKLRQTLKDLAKEKGPNGESIFKGYASLVICLLSHGGLGTVFGVDGLALNVLELQWTFNSDSCPDLSDKPKIFIIQACQGEIWQRMIPAIKDEDLRGNGSTCSPALKSGIDQTDNNLSLK